MNKVSKEFVEAIKSKAELIEIHCSTERCECGEECNNCNAHYVAKDILKLIEKQEYRL